MNFFNTLSLSDLLISFLWWGIQKNRLLIFKTTSFCPREFGISLSPLTSTLFIILTPCHWSFMYTLSLTQTDAHHPLVRQWPCWNIGGLWQCLSQAAYLKCYLSLWFTHILVNAPTWKQKKKLAQDKLGIYSPSPGGIQPGYMELEIAAAAARAKHCQTLQGRVLSGYHS